MKGARAAHAADDHHTFRRSKGKEPMDMKANTTK